MAQGCITVNTPVYGTAVHVAYWRMFSRRDIYSQDMENKCPGEKAQCGKKSPYPVLSFHSDALHPDYISDPMVEGSVPSPPPQHIQNTSYSFNYILYINNSLQGLSFKLCSVHREMHKWACFQKHSQPIWTHHPNFFCCCCCFKAILRLFGA